MAKIKILHSQSQGFSLTAKKILFSFADVDYLDLNQQELIKRIQPYHALIVRLAHYIDQKIIKKADHLKVLATSTTGINHIDHDFLRKQKIKLISLKGETSFLKSVTATAEHTLALMLALIRRVPFAHQSVMQGQWQRDLFYGQELQGKVLGIIGYGRLGKMVARYGHALGMKILAYDSDTSVIYPKYVVFQPLNQLLSFSDIVTLHVPLNKKTERFMNDRQFRKMKKGSFFINTSRGAIIDESSLVHCLKSQHLAGAAVDVLYQEEGAHFRTIENPLVQYAQKNQNCIITPHIGGAAIEALEKTDVFIAQKLKQYFRGKVYAE